MTKESWAAAGAVGTSLLAASCCLGPAVFLLFGVSVGALGSLAALEPLRPVFLVTGGAALAYAARRAWAAPRPEECADGACAPGAPPRRRMRRLVLVAAALYVLAVVYPYALAAWAGRGS